MNVSIRGLRSRLLQNEFLGEFVIKTNSKRNYIRNKLEYNHVAHPFKRVFVMPESVKYYNKELSIYNGLGRIRGGNWDDQANAVDVEEHWVLSGFRDRFEKEKPWKKTKYVREAERRLESKGTVEGYDNIDEFIKCRCNFLDELFENIACEGYKSQEKVHDLSAASRSSYGQKLEVIISIGRDGELLLIDGNHRFAISKILGIEIPVQVCCRHTRWQLKREEYYRRSSETSNYATQLECQHPDLQPNSAQSS